MDRKHLRIGQKVKHRTTGDLYEVDSLTAHPSATAPPETTDVFACYRLSRYDGMPVGTRVWLSASEVE
jgi:hypothetical protein